LLPSPQRDESVVEDVPPRLAKLTLEKKPPPPPPPPKKEEPKPEAKKEPKPKPEPKPVDRTQEARKKAQMALMPLDELADLRDNRMVDIALANRPLTDAARAGDVTTRSLVTSKVGQGSGGINTATLSRGFGGGGGGLAARNTTQVTGNLGNADGKAVRSGSGSKASRSREEIELVFDRNKGAIYALYNRALRDNPALQGKVVLELTIAPWGEVTNCRVLSSDLNDPELERKLIARVKLFRFEERDVEAVTTTKPIDFFPA
jgi:TonB family protein